MMVRVMTRGDFFNLVVAELAKCYFFCVMFYAGVWLHLHGGTLTVDLAFRRKPATEKVAKVN